MFSATPPEATCKLQALALMLFEIRDADEADPLPQRMRGVCFRRDALAAGLVADVAADHPVTQMNHTHRELDTTAGETAEAARLAILSSGTLGKWQYGRPELAELLQQLLADGRIHAAFVPCANRLLKNVLA